MRSGRDPSSTFYRSISNTLASSKNSKWEKFNSEMWFHSSITNSSKKKTTWSDMGHKQTISTSSWKEKFRSGSHRRLRRWFDPWWSWLSSCAVQSSLSQANHWNLSSCSTWILSNWMPTANQLTAAMKTSPIFAQVIHQKNWLSICGGCTSCIEPFALLHWLKAFLTRSESKTCVKFTAASKWSRIFTTKCRQGYLSNKLKVGRNQ